MNKSIPSFDIDVLLQKYIDIYENTPIGFEHNRDIHRKLMYWKVVIPEYYKIRDFGVHYSENNINTDFSYSHYDYGFDFCDEKGEKVLPFTKDNPLYFCGRIPQECLEQLPNWSKIKKVKLGSYTIELTKQLVISGLPSQSFGEYKVIYNRASGCNFYDIKLLQKTWSKFGHALMKMVTEDSNSLETRVKKLEDDMNELWTPGGVLCRAAEVSFKNNAEKLESEGLED